jgi:hypothetical protein
MDQTDDDKPVINFSAALGEAGHESELLGTEDVPDTGAVIRHPGDDDSPEDVEEKILRSIATRGVDGVT